MIHAHYFAHPIHTENIAFFPLGHEFPWVLELSGAKILACNKMLIKNIMRDEVVYQLLQHIKLNTVNMLLFFLVFWIPDISLKYKSGLHSVTSCTIYISSYSVYHIPYNVPFLRQFKVCYCHFFSFHTPPPPLKKNGHVYGQRKMLHVKENALLFVRN